MALELLKPAEIEGGSDAGIFNLPPAFDSKRYAAEWVLEDQVALKRQRQHLVGTNLTADGWEVWRAQNKDNPTTVTGAGNKKFVLMCRPRDLQNQVNAAFGNVSKKMINREVTGETVAGEGRQDPGVLTVQQLGGGTAEAASALPENNLETVSAATRT